MKRLALVLMLTVAGLAQGAIFDDFEDGDFTTGTTWTVMNENSADPWFVTTYAGNSLEMPATSGSLIRLNFDQAYENEVVTVEYDVFSRWPSPVDYRPFTVALLDTATSTGVEMWCTPSLTYGGGFGGDGSTSLSGFGRATSYNGGVAAGGLKGALVGGSTDGWQHYKIVFDPILNNVKMYQDGVIVLDYGTSANKINALEFEQKTTVVKYQFDNVSVVPEPATMLLLGLGSLASLLRKRK